MWGGVGGMERELGLSNVSVGQLQWAVPGIQLIGRSERTLCSRDNCSQDVCVCLSVYVRSRSSIFVRTRCLTFNVQSDACADFDTGWLQWEVSGSAPDTF